MSHEHSDLEKLREALQKISNSRTEGVGFVVLNSCKECESPAKIVIIVSDVSGEVVAHEIDVENAKAFAENLAKAARELEPTVFG